MPDTVKQAPAQEQNPLNLSFFYTSKGEGQLGEAILKKLGEPVLKQLGEEKSYASVFPAATAQIIRAYHKGSLKKEDYATPADFLDQVVKPVLEDFLNVTCPSAKKKPQVAQWIFKQYLSHRHKGRPIKAKDLHKIGENILYFDKVKLSAAFRKSDPKPNSDLPSYKTYAAFEEMLKPFQQSKAKNKKLSSAFRISTREKAYVKAETTMLYNGPKGKVFVVNTPRASISAGNNTKWCISGSKLRIPGTKLNIPGMQYGRIFFPGNNRRSPIIMLLPKGQDDNKIVLVNKKFNDYTGWGIDSLPQPHHDLMQSCLASLTEDARKSLEPWIPKGTVAGVGADNPVAADLPDTDPALLEKVVKELDDIKASRKKPDAALWSSRDFVSAAVRQDASALRYAARKLRKDHDFVTSLLEECDDLPFNLDRLKRKDLIADLLAAQGAGLSFNFASMKKVIKRPKKVWRPGDAQVATYKMQALERMAEKGDREKFVQYSRRYKSTWSDAETFFAADPAATIEKIKNETAAQRPSRIAKIPLLRALRR
jgi:hypothetical protein